MGVADGASDRDVWGADHDVKCAPKDRKGILKFSRKDMTVGVMLTLNVSFASM
jgi:hypothetical protein